MKCPYQTIITHRKEEKINEYVKNYVQDIIEFGKCCKGDCPFYYTTAYGDKTFEHCKRAEREE